MLDGLGRPWEILYLDDGSRDGSDRIVAELEYAAGLSKVEGRRHDTLLRSAIAYPDKALPDGKTRHRPLHILLVEDIMDSGVTVNYLKNMLQERGPASLKVCVLLDKPGTQLDHPPVL